MLKMVHTCGVGNGSGVNAVARGGCPDLNDDSGGSHVGAPNLFLQTHCPFSNE